MDRHAPWPEAPYRYKEVSYEEVCTVTLARSGVQHNGVGVSCRHVLFELVHERELQFDLGPVSQPVAQSVPGAQSVSEPVSESKPVSGPGPVSESVSKPMSESYAESLHWPELALVMVLGQLQLHFLLQLSLWRHELLQRLGSIGSYSHRTWADIDWSYDQSHVRPGGGPYRASIAGAGRVRNLGRPLPGRVDVGQSRREHRGMRESWLRRRSCVGWSSRPRYRESNPHWLQDDPKTQTVFLPDCLAL
jgi:hypothetical protein